MRDRKRPAPNENSLAIAVLLGALVLVLTGCGSSSLEASGGDDALRGKLVITGSSTVAPLLREIARRFEASHPQARIDVQTGGSSRGIADARRGLADIGMSSRALTPDENAVLLSHTLARDGVAVLVHASNPVPNLTDEQVRGIYTGRISHWADVGGHDAAITVVNRADGRSELEIVCDHLAVQPADLRADLVSGENQHGIKTVAGDPDAIIYMSVGASEYAVREGLPVRLVSWNGVSASAATVASAAFPVTRPLILVTPPTPSPLARAFIDFACSGATHDLIGKFQYVPPS